MAIDTDSDLRPAILASLDDLLASLDVQPLGDDRFALPTMAPMFDRIYGGQLLAQAVVGAAATVDGKDVHSLHAAFVKAGASGVPVEVVVDRVRDGRSVATRQVSVVQDGQPLLVGLASFHTNGPGPELAASLPDVPAPDEVPSVQYWARALPPDQAASGRYWVQRPPAVELHLAEPPTFLGGTGSGTTRSHWMRLPRPVGDDPVLHAALLAYASDYFLMDIVFRAPPDRFGPGRANGFSLDHALWFHRPVRFDRWHLHTQDAVTVVGERGLARGAIRDADGHLVASVAQEVLVRPMPAP